MSTWLVTLQIEIPRQHQAEGEEVKMYHFARPALGAGNKGRQICRECGGPIVRVGRHTASDGVKGSWTHEVKSAKVNPR